MDSLQIKEMRLEQLLSLIEEQLAQGKNVKFQPRGVSMLPMLRQGIDSVVLSPVPARLRKYDLPLYRRDNGQFVLHRVVKAKDGVYACVGDNQYVVEENLRHDQMIALVTAFYRGKRERSVHAPAYLLYCRFWYASRPLRYFIYRACRWLKRHMHK